MIGDGGMHPRLRKGPMGMLVSVAVVGILILVGRPTPVDGASLAATLDGRPMALGGIPAHYCNDRSYPVIRCFSTPAAEELDASLASPDTGTFYVTWYQNSNFGGYSFSASRSYPDLSVIGWQDTISSFRAYNGSNPHWFEYTNYQGYAVYWGVNVSVSYVGDAFNDRFVGVEVPG